MGRQFAWRCLTKCNILNLNTPVVDELFVFHLTDLLHYVVLIDYGV